MSKNYIAEFMEDNNLKHNQIFIIMHDGNPYMFYFNKDYELRSKHGSQLPMYISNALTAILVGNKNISVTDVYVG